MKVSSVCFALAIFLSNSVSVCSLAQETDSDRKLAEMQTTIESLKAELDSLKKAQNIGPALEAPVKPPPPQPTWQESSISPVPARPDRYPADFGRPQTDPRNQTRYRDEYQRRDVPHPYPQQFAPPVVERVIVQQPAPVFVEPAFCPHGGFGGGYYGGYDGFGRGYPSGGLYVGPNGWGFGVGGLQFNFSGHGGHYGGHKGHHGGHKGHKGHK